MFVGNGVSHVSFKDPEYCGKPRTTAAGIAEALKHDTEYVYVTMNDVVLYTGALEAMVNYMEKAP